MFRKMLADNIETVQNGGEPMNVFRDPIEDACLELRTEVDHGNRGGSPAWKYSPMTAQIDQLFAERDKVGAR
jgi:hypothetical protein